MYIVVAELVGTSTQAKIGLNLVWVNSSKSTRYNHERSMVKTATGQNGDTETSTGMAIFKTATSRPSNTYSFSEAYIIDRRLYT